MSVIEILMSVAVLVLYVIPAVTIWHILTLDTKSLEKPFTKRIWLHSVVWPIALIKIIMAIRSNKFAPEKKEKKYEEF